MTKPRKTPLAGIKILDFSRVIAGPLCTQQLADLGAEIFKIENTTTGDEVRGFEPDGSPGRSPFFKGFNRTKKSVAINLKSSEGCEIALALAGQCDVLIENFRPGVMKKFGLDQATVRRKYPRIIYLSISAYGADVPMADRPGFDPVLQAESGMMELTGEPDGAPMRTGLSFIDTLTASHAATAICAALLARQHSDEGDYIDLALLDTAVAALGNMAMTWLSTGKLPSRAGNSHIEATPTDLFRTSTEPIYLAVSSNKLFRQLCEDVLDRSDLPDDPDFINPKARLEHRVKLKALIEDVLLTEPASYWLKRMRHLPAGRVRTLDQALVSEEVIARGMVQTVTDNDGAEMQLLGSNFKFEETPLQPAMPPPRHGQHTEVVLSELLGFSEVELAKLRAGKIIR
jgi:succinate--hydroxymethylglutarate CoA-transferase